MTKDNPGVKDAYALKTPDDSRKLYAGWADTYDNSFAVETDYILHVETAHAFQESGGEGPVLDVGAGTGLCGAILAKLDVQPIDATDISAEMLERAMQKGVYRDAVLADITLGLPVPAATYRGIVSSGTFTTGHVGPNEIDHLLRVTGVGAKFALSINAKHYETAGFAAKFDDLGDAISGLVLKDVPIYGYRASGEHRHDRAFIALFSKT